MIYSQEVAVRIGRSTSTVFAMEVREVKGTLTLREMVRYADALGCKVVYGVVPKGGRTLEELYEERLWAVAFGTEIREERGLGNRVGGLEKRSGLRALLSQL